MSNPTSETANIQVLDEKKKGYNLLFTVEIVIRSPNKLS